MISMRKLLVVLLAGLIHLYVAAQQPACKTIRLSNDLEVVKISDDAYIHVSWTDLPGYGRISANGLILINGKEAFLFDTPWNDALTQQLYFWITGSLKLTISGFIPNHWHSDCMGGLGVLLRNNIETYANQLTVDIARAKKLPLPAHGFRDSLQLCLGNKMIECFYFGPAHSSDNIVVWIPSEKILFAGCMVKSIDATNLGNTADGDLTAYPRVIDRLLSRFPDAKIVIPGHGKFGGLELILHTKELTSR